MGVFEICLVRRVETQKVSGLVAGALDKNTVTVDLTDSGLDFRAVSMTEDDVAVISVPAYAGRVPAVVVDRLGIVRGNGARTVLVCVYGNRAFEDTLVELEDVAKRAGFRVVAAVSAIAEHSVARQFVLGDRMRRMRRSSQSLRSKFSRSCWLRMHPSPLFPAIVLINKLEVTAWHPRQQRIASPAVHAPRRASFALSTRATPSEQLARRASPACAASRYVREALASLIPTSYPLFPRCWRGLRRAEGMRTLHLAHTKLVQRGQSEICPWVPAEKEHPQVLPKYRLSKKKYRSPVIMTILALGLSTIAPVKRNAEGYRVPRRGPNQSL